MSGSQIALPGSALFLIRHELRLGWRRSGLAPGEGKATGRTRTRRIVGWAVFGTLVLLLQIGAFPIARLMADLPDDAGLMALVALSGGIGTLWALMVSHALDSGTQAIFLRGDHDLLISSPVPPRRVFAIRALTIAVNVVTVYAAITLPLVIALVWYGQFRWLAIYPVLMSLGLSAAAVGLTLCFALFGLIGPRRTRIVAQVLGAVIGASIFLVTQSEKLLPAGWRTAVIDWAGGPTVPGTASDTNHLAWWPARALMGQAMPNFGLLLLALALFGLVVWSFGERFARNAVLAADLTVKPQSGVVRKARSRDFRRRGLFVTQVLKEWRLLARDPWLVSQSLMQTLYLLPICFAFAGAGSRLSLLAPMTVVLAGNLASGLIWVTVLAEDAPDLVASAPVNPLHWRLAKLVAALTPVLLILLLPLAALASQSIPTALVALAGCLAASVGAVVLAFSTSEQSNRKDFAKRHKRSLLAGIAEPVSHLCWSGAVALALDASLWALLPAAAALAFVAGMWVFRPASAA